MISSILDAGRGTSSQEDERPSSQALQRAISCAVSGTTACFMDEDPARDDVKGMLLTVLNDATPDSDMLAQEAAMQLIASLASSPRNSGWVLDVLGDLDANFEHAFKIEELWSVHESSGRDANGMIGRASLHTWMALALIRVMGQQLKASHILQMTDGRVPEAVANLISVCRISADGTQADGDSLMVHGVRLLFELTTFDATFDEEICDSFSDLKRATAIFQQQNNELIGAVIRLPVLDTLIEVLGERVQQCHQPEGEAVVSSIKYSLMMLHNLLLYSTEKSTQLRKHIAGSGFVPAVLDVFLSSMMSATTRGPSVGEQSLATTAANMRTALRIICVATHKVGQLKQHYLKSEILASCLAALDGLPPDHTMKDIAILARIACNIDVSPSPGGLLDHTSRMIRARDEDCKNKIRHYFWQESSVVPVARTTAAHQRLSATDLMGSKPPPSAAGNKTKPEPPGSTAVQQHHRNKASLPAEGSNEEALSSTAKQPTAGSGMTTSQKNRRKRQRKRAKLRAEHARAIGFVQQPEKSSGSTARSRNGAPVPEEGGGGQDDGDEDEDAIPEDLPDEEDINDPQSVSVSAQGRGPAQTRRIIVKPKQQTGKQAGSPPAAGKKPSSSGSAHEESDDDSDFDVDDILQEVGGVGVQLLSSEQQL